MDEESEYLKLPIEERCVHKNWKARMSGYEEATKVFSQITDEKSPEFTKFASLMKKFVSESNVFAQEKALCAVLSFAENAHIAGKIVGEVISTVVTKCFASGKKPNQERAVEVILMYCEIEKYEIVQDELIKGLKQKNPKVVCCVINAITTALCEFGNKVMAVKPLVKVIGPLLDDRDKNIREETKKMIIEMYRWVGDVLKPQMNSLKPIQVQELSNEFEKLPKEKAIPIRYLRSQQARQAKEQIESIEQEDEEQCLDEEEELNPIDLADPVNVLDKLPADFYEKLEAKKWQERKEAVDLLLPLTQNQKLESGEYGKLVSALKKIVTKDTNVMIIAVAGQCLAGLARGLQKRFSPYAINCLESILEKFKEKKINVVTALRDAADAIYHSVNIETVHDLVISGLNNKNPNVKAETAAFIARSFAYCTPAILNKKLLKTFVAELLKTLNVSDPTVRENSAEALGTAMKVVSEKNILPFLSDVDSLKMQKIKEFSEKVEIKVKIKAAKPPLKPAAAKEEKSVRPSTAPATKTTRPITSKTVSKKPVVKSAGAKTQKSKFGSNKSLNEYDQHDEQPIKDSVTSRTNISELCENIITELRDKNWKVRMEALGKLSNHLTENPHVEADIGTLPDALVLRLSDINKNIVPEALKVTSELSSALGVQCKTHNRIMVPGIFAALGDSKKNIREIALSTLNEWVLNCGSLRDVIDGDMCVDALRSGSPFLKVELLLWLTEKLENAPVRSLNKEELKNCVPFVFAGLEDRSAEMRKASHQVVASFMLHLGYDAMSKQTSRVKPSSMNTVNQALEKAKANMPVITPQSTASSRGKPAQPGQNIRRNPDQKKPAAKSRPTSGIPSGARPSKKEEVDNSPLLQNNDFKKQRVIDENRMRILKWEFQTPKQEFITQLKEQMVKACLNQTLFNNMFHADFKFHIKAIDSLMEDLSINADASVANLDLILRWITIRFFDTNTSVILKAMEYLTALFNVLADMEYSLSDHEAYSFIPFLVMKFGDPKDSIRAPTKNILTLVLHIYPASKVAPYIFDGLKSKNARQRAECLDMIGYLIEMSGMPSIQPNAANSVKEIAKQVADRDNGVRNAALNALVQIYYIQGEKIYKLIGQISDKELSLIEERIKRSKAKNPIKPQEISVRSGGAALSQTPRGVKSSANIQPSVDDVANNNDDFVRNGPPRNYTSESNNNASSTNMYRKLLESIVSEDDGSRISKYKIEHIDDMETLLQTPVSLPVSKFSRSRLNESGVQNNTIQNNTANDSVLDEAYEAVFKVIYQICSTDTKIAIEALYNIRHTIESDKMKYIKPHVDQLLVMCRHQYQHVLNTKMSDPTVPKSDCLAIYQKNTACLAALFNVPELATEATSDTLHDIVQSAICVLLDSRLTQLEDSSMILRPLNVLIFRIIDNANFSNVLCALMRLLLETVRDSKNEKMIELVMKCNWKAQKLISVKYESTNPTQIIQQAHEFLTEFPISYWADKKSEPLKTIKLTLHGLIKNFGRKLLDYTVHVPNFNDSECHKYINKYLNRASYTGNAEEVLINTAESSVKSPKNSQKKSDILCAILGKIGVQKTAKQGIRELYDFKRSNSDVDLNSYLGEASEVFKNFIQREFEKIENETKENESKISNNQATAASLIRETEVGTNGKEVGRKASDHLASELSEFKKIAMSAGFDNNFIEKALQECRVQK